MSPHCKSRHIKLRHRRLNVACGEVFGLEALKALEIKFDFAHLSVYVAIGNYCPRTLDKPPAIVQAVKQYRHSGFRRDKIKTFAPLRIGRARALWSDAKVERLRLLGSRGQAVGHVAVA